MYNEKIGFIGGGNMAYALGSGFIKAKLVAAEQIHASGPNIGNLQRWRDLGCSTTTENYEIIEKSDIVFICVKPHMLEAVGKNIEAERNKRRQSNAYTKIYVSVLAGVTLVSLNKAFSFLEEFRVIRVMPNNPIQIGEGCTVYCPSPSAWREDVTMIDAMLNSLGTATQIPEKMIDAATAIAGCGPAYIYTIIEALADAGVQQGIPKQMAIDFAAQMVHGTAKTVLRTGKHPALLRDEVCSPGGSTIAGVYELEKGGIRATLMNAVKAATERSTELGIKK